jgi:WD40 repeat protein
MPDRRMLRRALAAALALAVVGALSACVGIPGSGPVSQGLSLSAGSGGANFDFNPEGPVKGASRDNILKGFVGAFTSATGGYAVAKEFLTSGFAGKWDPRQSVQVRTGAPRIVHLTDTTTQYSFSSIASVDAFGAYTESAQPITLQFGFAKEGGEWRINAAPSGIVLSDQTFQRIFTQHALYFLDPGNAHLIPDLRWFPRGTAATGIVTALLAGPPNWLKGAAFSRFPDGTQLTDAGSLITPVDGVANIDLTKEALSASTKDRQLMRLQLSESLRSVSSISSVKISVAGTPLQIDDLGSTAPQADTKVDGQALVLRKGAFGFYANGQVAPLSQLSQKVVNLVPRAATLSSDGNSVAVLGTGGVSLVRKGTAAAVLVDPRGNLIAPSLDENGYVWSVPSDQPNAIRATDAGGVAHAVAASLPGDSQVRSIEVSRDGARIAILLSTVTGPRLIVAAILRDPDQVPVSLKAPIIDFPLAAGAAIDATWVDQLTVATLVTTGSESTVQSFTIGGQRTPLGSLPSAQAIVGGNGQNGLRVLADDSTIWAYQGSSWQSTGVKVDFIATQR